MLRTYHVAPLTPDELCFNPSVLKIIPSIPALDGTDPDRGDVCYVGRLLAPVRSTTDVDFDIEPDWRYVFVYMGTGSVSLDRVQEVLPQIFPEGSELCCAVGAQSIDMPFQRGTVAFYPYVPVSELLPHCDWTLCHGGQNTIIQSLMHGVPLQVFPGAIFERRYNARQVKATGAGQMGEADQFTVVGLRTALERQAESAPRAAALAWLMLAIQYVT